MLFGFGACDDDKALSLHLISMWKMRIPNCISFNTMNDLLSLSCRSHMNKLIHDDDGDGDDDDPFVFSSWEESQFEGKWDLCIL